MYKKYMLLAIILLSLSTAAQCAENTAGNEKSNSTFNYSDSYLQNLKEGKQPVVANENITPPSSVSTQAIFGDDCSDPGAIFSNWKTEYAYGTVHINTDREDWVEVYLTPGRYRVDLFFDPADLDVYVYGGCSGASGSGLIKSGTSTSTNSEQIDFTITSSKYYKIKIFDYDSGLLNPIDWELYISSIPEITLQSPANYVDIADTTPYFDWTSTDGGGYALSNYIYLDDDSNVWSGYLSKTYRSSYTSYTPSTALSPGTYYWGVKASNGYTTGYSNVRSFTITDPNNAPSVTLVDPANNIITTDTTPYFDWISNDADGDSLTNTIYIGTGNDLWTRPLYKINRGADTYYPRSAALSEGTYYWGVEVTDGSAVKRSEVRTFTVSVPKAPVVSLTRPSSGTVINDNTPYFNWGSSDANGDVLTNTIYIDNDNNPWSNPLYNINKDTNTDYQMPSTLSDGTYYWGVSVYDEIFTTKSGVWSFRVDTSSPDTYIDSGPSGTVSDKSATFTFHNSEIGSRYSYKLDSGAWSGWTTASSASYSGLSENTHTFYVRARDKAGNIDSSPASRTWTISALLPDLSIISADITFEKVI